MGDGYWENDGKTVFICTENLTNFEVLNFHRRSLCLAPRDEISPARSRAGGEI